MVESIGNGYGLSVAGMWLLAGLLSLCEVSLATSQWGLVGPVSRRAGRLPWEMPADLFNALAMLRYGAVVGYVASGWSWVTARAVSPIAEGVTLVVGVVLLVIGQLVGSAFGRRFAHRLTPWAVVVGRVAVVLLAPLVIPLHAGARWLSRRLGGETELLMPLAVVEGARARAAAAERPSQELVSSLLEFADTVAREIMVPRTEMVTIAADWPLPEIRQVLLEAGHARVPVYDETVDNVIGILHSRDLFAASLREGPEAPLDLRKLARPTFYVPQVMKISELLREFQRRKTHMAIVVDEYGGTAGLVTLEDVLEVIVGDIHDETDVDDKQFKRLGEGKVLADGRVSLWDLEPVLAVKFPAEGTYETLAGLVVSLAGTLPKPGAVFQWQGLKLTVREADERRIKAVEVERLG